MLKRLLGSALRARRYRSQCRELYLRAITLNVMILRRSGVFYGALQTNYSVQENPGLGNSGLYYYYQLMSKCLDALGSPTFVDASGVEHNWRAELAAELANRQNPDGSWTNPDNRWY
ncbi:MAG: hypothetical protein K1X74_16565, partial [Pirellulales bacterium]|nr:hypothetical protein [Pirellulales bacterium]